MVRKSGNYHRKDIIETFEKRSDIHYPSSLMQMNKGYLWRGLWVSPSLAGKNNLKMGNIVSWGGILVVRSTPYEWSRLQVKTETGKATTFLEREAPQKKVPGGVEFWVSKKRLGIWLENSKWVMSKKSPTGPTERTPKPEYLIALATSLGVRW